MVLAQVTLHHRSSDAHSWRLFRWRPATPEDMDSLSDALDLAWGWLSLSPALPDHYIATHHFIAHAVLPRPPDTPTLLRHVARFTFPLSTHDLAAQSSALQEASAARGHVSRTTVLASPSITSATRTVLRLASPPLEPSHGILFHPGATLATREERLAEVTAQSRSQTANRHVSVDHAFFGARCLPDLWLPLRHPPTDLTLPLLRDALRANARPESPVSLMAYALARKCPPLITTTSLAHRRMGKRSLAVSTDNVARAALFCSGGSVHLGLLHLLLQLKSGTPGVSNETVRYGLYKGKPTKPLPRHLTRSFRPVDVESGVSGAASGIATTRLAADLELTSTYTPASFAYRPGHCALGLALAARAATYTALSTHGTYAICDWDESDAYLMVLRQDNSRLCSHLRASWDFGPWADGFYTRLVIRVATREGFTHIFSTEEGGNQGDGCAQLHYQAPSLVITRAMRPNSSIALPLDIPGHSVSLPATHLTYCDDRRFITPSLADVAAMATDCRECSRRACRIIHPEKQEFSLIDSRPGRPTLITADVPRHTITTSTTPPGGRRHPHPPQTPPPPRHQQIPHGPRPGSQGQPQPRGLPHPPAPLPPRLRPLPPRLRHLWRPHPPPFPPPPPGRHQRRVPPRLPPASVGPHSLPPPPHPATRPRRPHLSVLSPPQPPPDLPPSLLGPQHPRGSRYGVPHLPTPPHLMAHRGARPGASTRPPRRNSPPPPLPTRTPRPAAPLRLAGPPPVPPLRGGRV